MNKSQKALSTGDMWEHTGCFLGIFSLKERFQQILNFILGPIESKQYFLLDLNEFSIENPLRRVFTVFGDSLIIALTAFRKISEHFIETVSIYILNISAKPK
jgi:hypothetical protein